MPACDCLRQLAFVALGQFGPQRFLIYLADFVSGNAANTSIRSGDI